MQPVSGLSWRRLGPSVFVRAYSRTDCEQVLNPRMYWLMKIKTLARKMLTGLALSLAALAVQAAGQGAGSSQTYEAPQIGRAHV